MNKNPEILLPDGEPVHCYFMQRADAPIFWERCENNATYVMDRMDVLAFDEWKSEHPRAIIGLYPASGNGCVYLCDKHEEIVLEVL